MYVGNYDFISGVDLPGELNPRDVLVKADAHLMRAVERERRLAAAGYPGAVEHLALLLGEDMETPHAAGLAITAA